MGGDTPLDYKDEIYEICGVEEFPENGERVELTKEDLENNLEEILKMVRESKYDKSIAFQVLGILLIGSGASITDELKEEIIKESSNDEWAQEDEERKDIIEDFNCKVKDYNGAPIKFEHKGLFDVMLESIVDDVKRQFIDLGKKVIMVFYHITPEDNTMIVESMFPEDIEKIKASDIMAVDDVDNAGNLVTYMICNDDGEKLVKELAEKYFIEHTIIDVTEEYIEGYLRIDVDAPFTPWNSSINQ